MTINFELLKVSKKTSLRIYISHHGETRSIKSGQQDKPHQKLLLGTPPQKELTSAPPIHVTLTNLFICTLWDYCYQIWAVKTNP